MSGWLTAVLLCAAILLIGRSFYVIYVRGIRSRLTVGVAWSSLTFMTVFWAWFLVTGGW
ncbi:MAG: hypothetical protein L0Z62_01985 [Gemmataceae bacterium]|nr:hypothetical protein [Gemmataceae bacterium]